MKELTIEQKAKAYDEAIERAKDFMNGEAHYELKIGENIMCWVFPELRESEDERMRKALIDYFRWNPHGQLLNEFSNKEVFSWLEEQGEQKPILDVEIPFGTDSELVEEAITIPDGCYAIIEDNKVILRKGEKKSSWSEEDELQMQVVIYLLPGLNIIHNWLKTIKDRVQPQSKQEWSEEDEERIKNILSVLDVQVCWDGATGKKGNLYQKEINWLKSLRPQNWTKEDKERYISCLQRLGTGNPEQPETINSKWFKEHVYPQCRWKPSKEQMDALENAIRYGEEESIGILSLLYNDLKKLREE